MNQGQQLPLERCPHCNIAKPQLNRQWGPVESNDFANQHKTAWSVYRCMSCGGMTMAFSLNDHSHPVKQIWPRPQVVAEEVPIRAKEFLTQAISSIHAPAGAVMLTASAVDAMLKEKGLKDGSLYTRIDAAAKSHTITEDMAAWAHEIRLDANDQRHSDESAGLPSEADAKKAIEFASVLAQIMFVLPSQVQQGRKSS